MRFVPTRRHKCWLLRAATYALVLAVLLLPVRIHFDGLNATAGFVPISKFKASFVPLAKLKKSFNDGDRPPLGAALVTRLD